MCLSLPGENMKQTEKNDLEAAAAAEEKEETDDDDDGDDKSVSKSKADESDWKCDRCLNPRSSDQSLCLVCQRQKETNTDGKWQMPSVVESLGQLVFFDVVFSQRMKKKVNLFVRERPKKNFKILSSFNCMNFRNGNQLSLLFQFS